MTRLRTRSSFARPTRGARRRERAQALLEFAIVLPLFVLLVLATIDFARLLFTDISLANGVREMARSASISTNSDATVIGAFNNLTFIAAGVNPNTDSVTIAVTDATSTAHSVTCKLPLGTATCSLPSRSSASGGYVDVTANYTFQYSPLFSAVLAGVKYVSFQNTSTVLTTSVREYVE